ncbi:hypothetical protein WKH57_01325 [Niallia taxi]|uniref:hypothetical protein n=1 Tax=Niallia taxi TaxID=2499688 RepID=UPI00317F563E
MRWLTKIFNPRQGIYYDYNQVVKQLEFISQSLYPIIDIRKEKDFGVYQYTNKVRFNSKNKKLTEMLPFKTLKLVYEYNTIKEYTYNMTYTEYYNCYLVRENKRFEELLSPVLLMLKDKTERDNYLSVCIRYAISIATVYNTIIESKEVNGEVTKNIADESYTLLSIFTNEVNSIKDSFKKDHNEEKAVVNNGLVERLREEVQYVKGHLITDKVKKLN